MSTAGEPGPRRGGGVADLVTVVPVMYRDAANYKTYGRLILGGVMTGSQIATVRERLDEGEYFVPEQLGMEHLGWSSGWGSFPCEDDHGWHEMDLEGIAVVPACPRRVVGAFADAVSAEVTTVPQFVARVCAAAAAGWQPVDPAVAQQRSD